MALWIITPLFGNYRAGEGRNHVPCYGAIQFTVEVVDHCGKSIEVVVDERAIVDEDAPVVIGTIRQFPGNPT